MMRNFLIALSIVAVVGVGSAVAAPVAAQTTDGLQGQIRALLARIAELTEQLSSLRAQVVSTTPAAPVLGDVAKHRICKMLARNLSHGVSGDDVASLQEFLREQGYLSANATGYYGALTRAAVARWQAAEGVSAVGAFGPISRERLRVWCGGVGTQERFGVSPQRGKAPLTVAFKTNVQLANSRFVADAGDYKIVFGDENEIKLPCEGDEPFCEGPHSVRHMYRSEGTYTAELVHYNYFGLPGPDGGAPKNTVARVQIHVGDAPAVCTKEYRPICGSKQVQCITTSCNPVQQTYSNRCMMEADGATFVHAGQCRSDANDPEKDRRCKAWYDGCNTCSRETPNGPAMCTLRACIQQAPAYCTAHFDNTDTPPVACTADARQCPDGSYVGRSGPNCQFVCPSY